MSKEPGRIAASAGVGFHDQLKSPTSFHEPAPEQFQLPRFVKFKRLVRVFAYIKIAAAVLVAGLKVFAICAVSSEAQTLFCGLLPPPPTENSVTLIVYVSIMHASLTWETQVILAMVRLLSRLKEENYRLTTWNMIELNTDLLEYPVLFLLFTIAKFNTFLSPKNGAVCTAFAYTIVSAGPLVLVISIVFLIILLSYRQLVLQLNATAASEKNNEIETAEVATMTRGEPVTPKT